MDNTLDTVQTILQHVHTGTVRESHKVMARAVKEITTTRGVQVEEDTGHNNDLLLETGLEEVETVGDGLGETLKVQPATSILVPVFQYERYDAMRANTYR